MSKIRFKQWDDFLLTTVSKIGLYAGAVGALVATGLSPVFAAAILVPDVVLSLFRKALPEQNYVKSFYHDKDPEKNADEKCFLIESIGDDFLRARLDSFCERGGINPRTTEIYYTLGLRNAFCSKENKIFCGHQAVNSFLQFEQGEDMIDHLISHELSHIVTGDNKDMPRAIDYIAAPVIAISALASYPEMSLSVLGIVVAFPFYQKAINLFALRVKEYRADRNAIALTGKREPAEMVIRLMDTINKLPYERDEPIKDMLKTAIDSYPQGSVRISALRKAFNYLRKNQPELVRETPSGKIPYPTYRHG